MDTDCYNNLSHPFSWSALCSSFFCIQVRRSWPSVPPGRLRLPSRCLPLSPFLVIYNFYRVHHGKQISSLRGISEKGNHVQSYFYVAVEDCATSYFWRGWKGIGSANLELWSWEDGISINSAYSVLVCWTLFDSVTSFVQGFFFSAVHDCNAFPLGFKIAC